MERGSMAAIGDDGWCWKMGVGGEDGKRWHGSAWRVWQDGPWQWVVSLGVTGRWVWVAGVKNPRVYVARWTILEAGGQKKRRRLPPYLSVNRR